jgi:hypothetical protein
LKTNKKSKEKIMKTTFMAVRGLGVGAAMLSILASAPVAHAALIGDLSASTAGELGAAAGPYLAQNFATPVVGPITGVTLDLDFNQAAVTAGTPLDVYIYHANAFGITAPFGTNSLLGTVTPVVAGATDYAVNLTAGSNLKLTPGLDYAIVVDTALAAGTVAWEYTTSGAAATANAANAATFLSGYTSADSFTWSATSGDVFQVQVVPEPSTNAIMGFGALALLAMKRMRSKQS